MDNARASRMLSSSPVASKQNTPRTSVALRAPSQHPPAARADAQRVNASAMLAVALQSSRVPRGERALAAWEAPAGSLPHPCAALPAAASPRDCYARISPASSHLSRPHCRTRLSILLLILC